MNIAVLASGNGSNFEAIAKSVKRGIIKANLKLLLTDKRNAFVRIRAKKFGIEDVVIDSNNFESRRDFDKEMVKILKKDKIDLVVLAGFMRVLSPYFVNRFKNRILNIHPAILPAFKGESSIKRAFDYGCKITGITVHFIDNQVDHGPIILQGAVKIEKGENLKTLEAKVHRLEHKLYPLAIRLFIDKKLKIRGRRVEII